ncbi:MAG: NAD(P)H-binding protein [Oscillochloris sp.]|nr:NAD(P)H-binding protein [Oscillochloris sp.]
MTSLMIYGANGYTGALIARRAVERGLRPTLAGRNAAQVAALAQELDLPALTLSLDDPATLRAALADFRAVLHCAGPFSRTSRPMSEACLRTGTHYLDITGEIAVFEALARRDAAARAAGVMLLPGVGFDVVPTDCLAAHLKRRLPDATHLELAFRALGRVSRGTATTAIENMGGSGAIRRNGRIVRTSPGRLTRRVDFGRGPVTVTAIPWGDVSTAYHSTGIPNIVVYTYLPAAAREMMRVGSLLGPLILGAKPVQSVLRGMIRRSPPGPNAEERERGKGLLWGEVRNAAGQRVVSRLITPEGYALTARSAVLIAEQVLAGDVYPGFQTPSRAYGPDLILAVDGVRRIDEDAMVEQ